MTTDNRVIRVLIADDDQNILDCYREAFANEEPTCQMKALDALAAELFDTGIGQVDPSRFDITLCSQGDDALSIARDAADAGRPFDVVILDVRMPPGIDGVETGRRIREFDSHAEIVFVTGFADMPLEELQRRVPPPMRLHYFNKPISFRRLADDVASMVREA